MGNIGSIYKEGSSLNYYEVNTKNNSGLKIEFKIIHAKVRNVGININDYQFILRFYENNKDIKNIVYNRNSSHVKMYWTNYRKNELRVVITGDKKHFSRIWKKGKYYRITLEIKINNNKFIEAGGEQVYYQKYHNDYDIASLFYIKMT